MPSARVLSICLLALASSAGAQDVAPPAKAVATNLMINSGEASLDFAGFIQSRYIANFREDTTGSDEWTQGFSHRRVRLIARGQINKQLGFYVSGDAASGSTTLFDGYTTWKPDDRWLVKFGQFKQNFLREDVIFDTRQLVSEKSTVVNNFAHDRSQGIDAIWSGESTRFSLGFSDGVRALNADFTSSLEADYALTASAEWKWAGKWKDFEDFVGFEGRPYAGSVRGAIHWQDGGETGGTIDANQLAYTIDTLAKGDGWNAFAAFNGRRIENALGEFDDFGVIVQGGTFVAQDWELFARYGLVLPDDDRVNGDDYGEATIGANHYIVPESHAAKFTVDLTWAMDDQAGSSSIVRPSPGNGLLAAPDDQYYLRFQFQILF
jgi:hypothetical protein